MSEIPGKPDASSSRPFSHTVAESHEFTFQPPYLQDGQHIMAQPPFVSLLQIAPSDFFIHPKSRRSPEQNLFGFLTALNRLHLFLPEPITKIPFTPQFFENSNAHQLTKFMNKFKLNYPELAFETIQKIHTEMEKYPFSYEYLLDKRDGFDSDGNPQKPKEPGAWYHTEMTFAYYQHHKAKNARLPRSIEFSEEGPRKRSNIDSSPIIPESVNPETVTFPVLFFTQQGE